MSKPRNIIINIPELIRFEDNVINDQLLAKVKNDLKSLVFSDGSNAYDGYVKQGKEVREEWIKEHPDKAQNDTIKKAVNK
jgi:hypothetical protein